MVIFGIANTIYFQPLTEVPSNSMLVSNLFVLVMILYTYSLMLQHFSNLPLYKQGLFWFNAGNLLYITVSFFFWAFFNLFLDNDYDFPWFLLITMMVVTIIVYALYGVGIIVSQKEHR